MKIGLALIVIAVVVAGLLIANGVRLGLRRSALDKQERARQNARWTVFVDPEGDEILVGVQRVARDGSWSEVVDQDIHRRVPCDLPLDERDTEVRIAKADARAYADLLNDEE
jgi:hypothetical protein